MPEHRLKISNYYSPVTAIKFLENALLVGQGPILKKYDWKSGQIGTQKTIFKHNNIHGIAANGTNKVVLWGGRSISIVDVCLDSGEIKEHVLNEWIIHVSYCEHEILIQTAHNTVLKVDEEFRIISITECLENSILYSGTILPQKNDKTLVAAGTVLGGIVVWTLEDSKILHNFVNHEGSIFGVTFSPDGKYLVSCSDDRSIRLWDLNTGDELAIGWGHHARIWQLAFIESHSQDFIYDIISVSEDCTARRWSISDKSLVVTDVFEGHQGGSVWCFSIEPREKVLATGGQDGKVLLFDVDRKSEINKTRMEYHLNVSRFASISKGETFKKFVCLSDKLICTTTTGKTLCTNIDDGNWAEIPYTPSDVYTMLCSFPDIGVACIAIRDGTIGIIRFKEDGNELDIMKIPSKSQLRVILPVTSGSKHYLVAESQNQQDSIQIISIEQQKLIHELNRPATFSLESVAYDSDNKTFYLGSRHGALALYNISLDDDMSSSSPTHCWRNLISNDPITSINIMPKSWSNFIFLTSSNGQYMIGSFEKEGSMTRVLLDKLPKGGIEGSWVQTDVEGNTTMLAAAFRQDQFYLYDLQLQVPLFSERCGGARRDWSLNISSENNNSFEMFYSKSNVIYRLSSPKKSKFSRNVLQQGTHGREIRCISISPHRLDNNGPLIIATSSEDTTIRFSTVDDRHIRMPIQTWSSQRKHISGIPTMKWTPDAQYLFSCSAQEEFLVWKVSNIQGKIFASLCGKLPTSVDDADVRIMSFDFIYSFREMSNKILVATVYSDSFIRLWILDLNSFQFSLQAEWRYRTCCLLNCDFLVNESRLYIAVSSTDGFLTIYDINSFEKHDEILHLQLHQSSVKSSFFHRIDENNLYHFSGGDDNALIVSKIDFSDITKSSKIAEISDAHSTTITAVNKYTSNDSSVELVTTATDQRVKLWEFSFVEKQLILKDSIYTAIADTGCLGVDEDSGTVIIGGSGLATALITKESK